MFFPRRDALENPFYVTASDGRSRLACFMAAPHEQAPLLIHFHGNGEVVADYVPEMAEELTGLGVNLLFAEYRGYGGSTGSPALGAMLDDAASVLAASGAPPRRVILFGRSIGSLFAIELAARHPEVLGLILESGIADPLERMLFRVSPEELDVSPEDFEGAIAARLDHRAKLARYAGPLLVLHAETDRLVFPSHAERNFAWAGAPPGDKELVLLPHGGHNGIFLSNHEQYIGALVRFLSRLEARRDLVAPERT